MVDETVPIARVSLARSTPRVLMAPVLAVALGIVAIIAGVVLVVGGAWSGAALGLVGLLAIAFGVALAVRLLTLRLDVDVGSVRLHWAGGSRQYVLARGPVTRVSLRADTGMRLRSALGFLGWIVGRARLRDGERIEAIRLAPSATLILVPIEGGRLGIAPASEGELIAALSAAARVQQRLEAVAARRMVLRGRPEATARMAAAPVSRPAVPPSLPAAPPPPPAVADASRPRFMTGIERVQLEERLAAERAVALAAAEAERQAAELAAAQRAAAVRAGSETQTTSAGPRRRAWRATRTRPPRVRSARPRPRWLSPPRGVLVELGVIALPIVVAAGLWLVALLSGRAAGDAARPLVLALVLAGPVAGAGVAAARYWWPRLVPLVVTSAMLALVMVGWSLVVV